MAAGDGPGRPTEYDPERCPRVAKAMAKLGATDREIAESLGIGERTFYTWLHEHPQFRQSVKIGKVPADARVERSLFNRAVGYSFDSEKLFCYEGEVTRAEIVEHVPPDVTAAIFWLKNRRKDRWRDFKATEISTPPGKPLEVEHYVPGPHLLKEFWRKTASTLADTEDPPAGAVPEVGRADTPGAGSDGDAGAGEE
jgi:hypothetical protein